MLKTLVLICSIGTDPSACTAETGDFAANDGGLGYGGGAVVFGAAIAVTVVLY